jgi:hypothetical protein
LFHWVQYIPIHTCRNISLMHAEICMQVYLWMYWNQLNDSKVVTQFENIEKFISNFWIISLGAELPESYLHTYWCFLCRYNYSAHTAANDVIQELKIIFFMVENMIKKWESFHWSNYIERCTFTHCWLHQTYVCAACITCI